MNGTVVSLDDVFRQGTRRSLVFPRVGKSLCHASVGAICLARNSDSVDEFWLSLAYPSSRYLKCKREGLDGNVQMKSHCEIRWFVATTGGYESD
jgi:hypothetical protein